MAGERKQTVRKIHDLVGERILKALEDETKPVRGSTMSTIVQFLKLNADVLQANSAEEQAERTREAMGRVVEQAKRQGKTVPTFDAPASPCEGPEEALSVPFVSPVDGPAEDQGEEPSDF